MSNLKRHRVTALAFILLVFSSANAATQQVFTVAQPIIFKPGNDKLKSTFAKIEDAKDVMEGSYMVATADLNDDGLMEIILQSNDSMYCGSGGCLTVVIEQPQPNSPKTFTLLSQNLGSSLAVTNEKIGNYRALASLMDNGQIQIADKKGTPLHGKQMVYPMSNTDNTVSSEKAKNESVSTL